MFLSYSYYLLIKPFCLGLESSLHSTSCTLNFIKPMSIHVSLLVLSIWTPLEYGVFWLYAFMCVSLFNRLGVSVLCTVCGLWCMLNVYLNWWQMSKFDVLSVQLVWQTLPFLIDIVFILVLYECSFYGALMIAEFFCELFFLILSRVS